MKHATWTESAVLQGFTADGETGFIARAQRHPAKARDWLWLHLFTPRRVHGFVEEHLPGTREVTRTDAPDLAYRLGNQQTPGGGVFQRRGPRDAPVGTAVFAYGKGHRGADVPEGAGTLELSVSGMLTPTLSPGASLKGRSEVLGTVTATIGIDKKRVEVQGFGHWHEQHQFAPRFASPFTYLSLVGDGVGLVAVRSPGRSSGFISRGEDRVAVTRFAIGPVGPSRRVLVTAEDGTEYEFVAGDAHRYTLPIGKARRPSSVVTARIDGTSVVGVINDWMVDEFPAELGSP